MRHFLILALLSAGMPASAATFGDQTAYTTTMVIRDAVAMIPASPAESGVCDSVTAYLRFNFDSCKARGALYMIDGNDTILVPHGITEERRFAANAIYNWVGFAFSDPRPSVVAGMTYFIAVFGDTAGAGPSGLPRGATSSGGGNAIVRNSNYESGFPSPINPTTSTTTLKLSVYVTYTPAAPISPRRRLLSSRSRATP